MGQSTRLYFFLLRVFCCVLFLLYMIMPQRLTPATDWIASNLIWMDNRTLYPSRIHVSSILMLSYPTSSLFLLFSFFLIVLFSSSIDLSTHLFDTSCLFLMYVPQKDFPKINNIIEAMCNVRKIKRKILVLDCLFTEPLMTLIL